VTLQGRLRSIEALFQRLANVKSGRSPLSPRRLQTARDVIDLIEEQVELLRADGSAGAVEKARTIGYLAAIACKAVETAKLADRVEILESILQKRKAEVPRGSTPARPTSPSAHRKEGS
jgi:hypothetical protein